MLVGRLLMALLLILSSTVQAENQEEAPADSESTPAKTPAPTEPPKPIERPPLTSRSDQQAQELARQYPKAAQTLTAADESFLAFWQPANTEQPKGTLILLPGSGETPDWPRIIGPLWRSLPDYGWHTLSVTLPDPDSDIPPRIIVAEKTQTPPPAADGESTSTEGKTDSETTPPPEETASEAGQEKEKENAAATPNSDATTPAPPEPSKPKPLAERINARIDAALSFAHGQEVPLIILLGHGTGGYWAAQYLAQEQAEPLRQLIVISPSQPTAQEPSLEEVIAKLTQTTGDFYYPNHPTEPQDAIRRRDACRRAKRTGYSQIPLPSVPGDVKTEQEQLIKRLRGWLDKNATAAE